jgi:hypothetical protein
MLFFRKNNCQINYLHNTQIEAFIDNTDSDFFNEYFTLTLHS